MNTCNIYFPCSIAISSLCFSTTILPTPIFLKYSLSRGPFRDKPFVSQGKAKYLHSPPTISSMNGSDSITSPKDAAQAVEGVTVHILSPSVGVPKRITFSNLEKQTTLGSIKQKIQDAVSSRPSPAEQRLLYRARPLINDGATLEDIFGSLEVWKCPDKRFKSKGSAHT